MSKCVESQDCEPRANLKSVTSLSSDFRAVKNNPKTNGLQCEEQFCIASYMAKIIFTSTKLYSSMMRPNSQLEYSTIPSSIKGIRSLVLHTLYIRVRVQVRSCLSVA
jgi:hypothetical protein